MSLNSFDKKFGDAFLTGVSQGPGVYLIYDEQDRLIYVGKAKNLRRRLGQYRNAKRRKKHRKMRSIVAEAVSIECISCETELDALLTETRMIQESRPKWNVEGAFFFLYPLIGLACDGNGGFKFCYTTHPERFPDFSFYGAYRSRWLSGEAFFALMTLLGYIGHRSTKKARVPGLYAYVFEFRRIPNEWLEHWEAFLRGESIRALEELILGLVENAAARRKSSEIQVSIDQLKRFWRHEARPLAKAVDATGFDSYPVPQKERDLVFLRYRGARRVSCVP